MARRRVRRRVRGSRPKNKTQGKGKTQIARKQTQSVALPFDPSKVAGQGMESVGAQDLLIPLLLIAQKNSPQVDENNPAYIAGVRPGMICNTGLQTAYDEIAFCPFKYQKVYIEWAPRDTKKGIMAIHKDASILERCNVNDRNQFKLPNGNTVVETAQLFGWQLEEGVAPRLVLVSMKSTQMRKARLLLTLAKSEEIEVNGDTFAAPLWWRTYSFGTVPENNAQGSWYGWTVKRDKTLQEFCGDNDLDFDAIVKQVVKLSESASQMNTGPAMEAGTGEGDNAGTSGKF